MLADDAATHQACPGLEEATYIAAEPVSKDDTLVHTVTLEEQLVPNKYAAEDYHFETPETDLITTVNASKSGKLRIYDYPGTTIRPRTAKI